MKQTLIYIGMFAIGMFAIGLSGCKESGRMGMTLFERENLVAWCIVPFDASERSPELSGESQEVHHPLQKLSGVSTQGGLRSVVTSPSRVRIGPRCPALAWVRPGGEGP